MKQCTTCKQTKPFDEFYKEKRFAVGYQAKCKECYREYKRSQRKANPNLDREYYLKNKEQLLTQKKVKYATDDKHRKRTQTRTNEYYAKNREVIKARVKLYATKNRDKISEKKRRLRENPEYRARANERSRKYRANESNRKILAHRTMQYTYRKYEARGFSTKQQLQWRWDYYGGKCWICVNEAVEIDHVIPLTKGGTNWPANLRPICRSCNARKSNTWPYPIKLI